MNKPILGLDVRLDASGRMQAWRAVLADAKDPRRFSEHLVRIPSSAGYIRPPMHPVHGDLTILPFNCEEQAKTIAELVRNGGGDAIAMAACHEGSPLERMLVWNGIQAEFVRVEMPADDTLDDPYYIGGEAGHEIAAISRGKKG